MGGLLGGSETTTTSSQPFTGVTATRFNSLYSTLMNNYNNPSKYTGQLSAGMNNTQQQAVNNLSNNANQQFLSDTMAGKYLDPDSNPYLQKSADKIKSNIAEQWGDSLNSIDSRVNKSGFWGGSGHQAQMEKSQRDLADTQGDALNNLYGNAYNTERQNQFNAANTSQNANSALMNAGNTQYGINDTGLQRQYQNWQYGNQLSQQNLENLLNYFNIGKNPTQSSTTEKNPGLMDIFSVF